MSKKRKRQGRLRVVNPDCAGIDIGKDVHYVAVPGDRCDDPVRSFPGFTRDLHELSQWLQSQQLKEKGRDDLVTVFILPPSTHDLEKRLITRAQDSPEIVARRMAKAADEMSHWAEYDYVIINRDIATSLIQLKSILTAERLKRERQYGLADFVTALREGR